MIFSSGMGFQPMPDIETTLIYSTKEGREEYVKSVKKVLDGNFVPEYYFLSNFRFFFFSSR